MKVSDMIIQKLDLFGHLSHLAQTVLAACSMALTAQLRGTALSLHCRSFLFQIEIFQNVRVWGYKLRFHWTIFNAFFNKRLLSLYWDENNEISRLCALKGRQHRAKIVPWRNITEAYNAPRRGKRTSPVPTLTLKPCTAHTRLLLFDLCGHKAGMTSAYF